MRVLLLICAVFFCQSCGSLLNNSSKVCDGSNSVERLKIEKKINSGEDEQATSPASAKKGEKSLLLYRLLNSL